jgi:hypothetical protein
MISDKHTPSFDRMIISSLLLDGYAKTGRRKLLTNIVSKVRIVNWMYVRRIILLYVRLTGVGQASNLITQVA